MRGYVNAEGLGAALPANGAGGLDHVPRYVARKQLQVSFRGM